MEEGEEKGTPTYMSIASFERVQGDVFGDIGRSDCHVISRRRSLSNEAERLYV